MTRFNLACYVLNVYSPEEDSTMKAPTVQERAEAFGRWAHDFSSALRESDKRVLANLPAMLEAVEENLQDLLPPGYVCRIREWSDDD